MISKASITVCLFGLFSYIRTQQLDWNLVQNLVSEPLEIPPSDRKHCTLRFKRAVNYGLRFSPGRKSFHVLNCWAVKEGMALTWHLLMSYGSLVRFCCVRCIEMMHLCNSSPRFPPKQTGCRLENKLTLLSQAHFLNFTLTRPLLPAVTRCASHRTPCWLQRALPLWGRWRAGFCRSAWLEIRNSLLLFLLLLLLLLLPFLMAHTKLTRRSVTAPSSDHEKTATNFPRGGGLWAQMLCICVLSICACQSAIST